ncbi:endogenous inhibitor of DNA gyrase (YacG/DUF329 family) [Sphingomonas sp. BE138]|uniref:DNA gyrase inhibitor YacG n=1 Tax=Sphingomonas sp. BE138 TaxID=2817845 RepID=UPI00285F1FCB|nr:DNA gyrase inhibitor YacG [Sphingomonas sp. BE138]MDR6789311.1 endogenous inhibitor of DNA gyrase (YacG/DUF329 family) [Sphingomonas sp. BE138]
MTTAAHCPICAKPSVPDHAPFCSRGCKDRDLLQWLGEGYRLPGETIDTESLDTHRDSD